MDAELGINATRSRFDLSAWAARRSRRNGPRGAKFAREPEATTEEIVARAMARVVIAEPTGTDGWRATGCWIWQGAARSGYGTIGTKKRSLALHRFMWEVRFGPIPTGLCVLHHCDNRRCCNPDHLFVGTMGDNNRDRDAKGRQAHSERNNHAKLTRELVAEIRGKYKRGVTKQRDLAKEYGIAQSTLWAIVTDRNWKYGF